MIKTLKLSEARIPQPTQTYDVGYMRQLINALTLFSRQFTTPIHISVNFLDASELPTVTDLADLPSGAVYNDAGTLKVKP